MFFCSETSIEKKWKHFVRNEALSKLDSIFNTAVGMINTVGLFCSIFLSKTQSSIKIWPLPSPLSVKFQDSDVASCPLLHAQFQACYETVHLLLCFKHWMQKLRVLKCIFLFSFSCPGVLVILQYSAPAPLPGGAKYLQNASTLQYLVLDFSVMVKPKYVLSAFVA